MLVKREKKNKNPSTMKMASVCHGDIKKLPRTWQKRKWTLVNSAIRRKSFLNRKRDDD